MPGCISVVKWENPQHGQLQVFYTVLPRVQIYEVSRIGKTDKCPKNIVELIYLILT